MPPAASAWLIGCRYWMIVSPPPAGSTGAEKPQRQAIQRRHSAKPYEYDRVPKRDERFPDPYNMGVNAEVFLYDEQFPPEPKTLMMFYKRLREVDVPEMMASIITETPGKPWEYYRDLTRQLWDEARHAMMGEVGFADLGIDWPANVMVNYTWSLALNTQLKPIERHAVLYFIEQGLMPKNGKRFEWEVGLASHNPLAALFQDYDWADEVLHARIGRDWYLKDFTNPQEARPLRRRMLVARAAELGKLAAAGPDPAPQLVAGPLPRSLPPLGHRARPESPGLLDHLPDRPRRPERADWIGVAYAQSFNRLHKKSGQARGGRLPAWKAGAGPLDHGPDAPAEGQLAVGTMAEKVTGRSSHPSTNWLTWTYTFLPTERHASLAVPGPLMQAGAQPRWNSVTFLSDLFSNPQPQSLQPLALDQATATELLK